MADLGIVVTGCFAEYAGVTYEFQNNKDALGFKQCCEEGGRPAACARKFNCINKVHETDGPSIGGPTF